MLVALIRHGATFGNLRGAYTGCTDLPLCPGGEARLAEYRKAGRYPPVDVVYTSPLLRCRQTASLVYPDREAVAVEGLRERYFGEFEGLTHREIISRPGFASWGMTPQSMVFPGGEPWEDFARRSRQAVWRLLLQCLAEGKSPAIVCHGGTIMAFMSGLTGEEDHPYHWQAGPGKGFCIPLPVDRDHILADRI